MSWAHSDAFFDPLGETCGLEIEQTLVAVRNENAVLHSDAFARVCASCLCILLCVNEHVGVLRACLCVRPCAK